MRTTCLLLSRGFASVAVALALLAVLTTGGKVYADECTYCSWSCDDCGQLATVGMDELMTCYGECDGKGCPTECICGMGTSIPCVDDTCSSGAAVCTGCRCEDKPAPASGCRCVAK